MSTTGIPGLLANLSNFTSHESSYSGFFGGGEERFNSFNEDLRKLGYSFVVRNSIQREEKESTRFLYSFDRGDCNIPFFGSPFQVIKYYDMECSQGSNYKTSDKSTAANPPHLDDHPSGQKRRQLIQSTKRIGCPAKLTIKIVKVFLGYEMKENKKSREKTLLIKQLKEDMDNKKLIKTEERVYINVSKESIHSHPTISSILNQQLHPVLKAKIRELVQRNVCSIRSIKIQLEECVLNMFKNSTPPHYLNRCYFPTDKTIINHMYKANFQIKKNKFDQEALEEMIKTWKTQSPLDHIFFRPYHESADETEDESTPSRTLPLLFCHQTKWQQDLMARYGNNISLLDATYKTTKYSLPLFFIAVKTNVGYTVVASFVVQTESAQNIKEALNMISSWNASWNPQFFMTDFSEAEINAVEDVFPNSTVYLCAFHREQAWNRWLKKSGNVLPGSEMTIKQLWRAIAKSTNITDYEDSLTAWNTSDAFTSNIKAQEYFSRQWIPHVHRWVPALQSQDFLWKVTTNNGIENQNRILKHKFLHHSFDKTLSGMIRVILEQFLPDSIKKYICSNAQMDPKYKSFNSNLPNFLHNRPINFIKHIWKRFKTAETEYKLNLIVSFDSLEEAECGIFTVRSENTTDSNYIVDFNAPSCSCFDFQKWKLPCKHMCAVFIYKPNWSFESLPDTYKNNPYFLVDMQYSAGIVGCIPGIEASGEDAEEIPEPSLSDEETLIIAGTPERRTTLTDNEAGTPNVNFSGTPDDDMSGTPDEDMSGTPEDNLSGTPDDDLSGTPEDNLSGTLDDDMSTTPDDDLSGTPEDNLSGTPEDNLPSEEKVLKAQVHLREKLKILMDLSYTMPNKTVLDSAAQRLEMIIKDVTQSSPKSNEGLLLLQDTQSSSSCTTTKQLRHTISITKRVKQKYLNLPSRSKKSKTAMKCSNRVGAVADMWRMAGDCHVGN